MKLLVGEGGVSESRSSMLTDSSLESRICLMLVGREGRWLSRAG